MYDKMRRCKKIQKCEIKLLSQIRDNFPCFVYVYNGCIDTYFIELIENIFPMN